MIQTAMANTYSCFRRFLSAQKLAQKPTKVEHKQLGIKQDATYLIILIVFCQPLEGRVSVAVQVC